MQILQSLLDCSLLQQQKRNDSTAVLLIQEGPLVLTVHQAGILHTLQDGHMLSTFLVQPPMVVARMLTPREEVTKLRIANLYTR